MGMVCENQDVQSDVEETILEFKLICKSSVEVIQN